MKKISILLLVVFVAASCSIGTYLPYAQNNFGAQSKVVLDKANFRVVRDVEAVVDVNNTRLSRADAASSAYGELLRKAQLTGSQVLINVVIEEVRRETAGFFRLLFGIPKRVQHVAARATIIEFLDENGNPTVSQPYRPTNITPIQERTQPVIKPSAEPQRIETTFKTVAKDSLSDTEMKEINIELENKVNEDVKGTRLKLRRLGWEKSTLGYSYDQAIIQVEEMDDAVNNMVKINQIIQLVFNNKLSKSVLETTIKTEVNKGKKEYQIYLELANKYF